MKQNKQVALLCATALLAALCFIGFQYFKIDIPVGAGKTAIHFGNTFCVLAALMLGGLRGGAAGAIGMGLADLLGGYATSMPKTIVMKLMMGIVTGLVAHRYAKIKDHMDDKKYVYKWSLIASIVAMSLNVVLDPIASFFYKNFILGVPYEAAQILAAWGALSTFINAITTVIFATILFASLSTKIKTMTFFKK